MQTPVVDVSVGVDARCIVVGDVRGNWLHLEGCGGSRPSRGVYLLRTSVVQKLRHAYQKACDNRKSQHKPE
jgi:hypothetical protein